MIISGAVHKLTALKLRPFFYEIYSDWCDWIRIEVSWHPKCMSGALVTVVTWLKCEVFVGRRLDMMSVKVVHRVPAPKAKLNFFPEFCIPVTCVTG